MKVVFILIVVLLAIVPDTIAQKQLVVLRKQKVMLRLYPGDEIVLKLKNSKRLKRSYVNNLLEHAVVTHRDTFPFNRIDRIYFRHSSRLNVIGGLLVFGGATLLMVDQLNNAVVQGNEAGFDRGFTTATLAGIGVGLPLWLLKKKSEKIGYKSRLMTVSKGSAFYQPDTRGYISPYMDN